MILYDRLHAKRECDIISTQSPRECSLSVHDEMMGSDDPVCEFERPFAIRSVLFGAEEHWMRTFLIYVSIRE